MADIERLKQLGWKKSAVLLILEIVNRTDDKPATGADAVNKVWNGPTTTAPCVFPFLGDSSLLMTAFDIKQNTTDILPEAVR